MSEANEIRAAIMEVSGELISVRVIAGEALVPLSELKDIIAQVAMAVAMNAVENIGGEGMAEANGQVKIALLMTDLIELLEMKASVEAL